MNELEQLKTEVMTIPQLAREVAAKITDNDGYTAGGEFLLEIKRRRKQVDAACDPLIDSTNKAHEDAVAQKRMFETPLAQAEGIIKPALTAWDTAQEQIRRKVEQEAQEAAHKTEVERKLAEAVSLEQQGDKQAAEQVMAEPVYVPPVIIPKTVPKVNGISYTERWNWSLVDINKVPRDFLKLDEVKVGQVARAMKSAANIPGIRVYSEKSVRGRG
ncbi:MAG: hypothetical protein M0R00_09245 [Candidatus Omnitrophica bacterium]|jgi:hypothetical protein|nr:hypothetical protein [Candidatus Omnitrophota bacterium]